MSRTKPRRIALLNVLHEHGPLSCLEVERLLGIAPLGKEIGKAKQMGQLVSLKRERLQPVKYRLTHDGYQVLSEHLQKQQSLSRPPVSQLPAYVPPKPMPVRAGSMVAYGLPSRGIGA